MERGEFRTAAAAGLTYGAGTQAVAMDAVHLLYTATRVGGGDGHDLINDVAVAGMRELERRIRADHAEQLRAQAQNKVDSCSVELQVRTDCF